MPHSRIMQKYVLIRQVLHQIILIVAHLKLETSTAVPMDPGQVHEEAVHQSTVALTSRTEVVIFVSVLQTEKHVRQIPTKAENMVKSSMQVKLSILQVDDSLN